MTKLINLFGGPGTGKSTTATKLFALMKELGFRVEYEPEWVKRHTYASRMPTQERILEAQSQRLLEKWGKVDWIVTDSPILMQRGYTGDPPLWREIEAKASLFGGFNVLLHRVKPYQPFGRSQTEDEARQIDAIIGQLTPFDYTTDADGGAHVRILKAATEERVDVKQPESRTA